LIEAATELSEEGALGGGKASGQLNLYWNSEANFLFSSSLISAFSPKKSLKNSRNFCCYSNIVSD